MKKSKKGRMKERKKERKKGRMKEKKNERREKKVGKSKVMFPYVRHAKKAEES